MVRVECVLREHVILYAWRYIGENAIEVVVDSLTLWLFLLGSTSNLTCSLIFDTCTCTAQLMRPEMHPCIGWLVCLCQRA